MPFLSEWRWVASPGHSPGHVSLWRERDGDHVIVPVGAREIRRARRQAELRLAPSQREARARDGTNRRPEDESLQAGRGKRPRRNRHRQDVVVVAHAHYNVVAGRIEVAGLPPEEHAHHEPVGRRPRPVANPRVHPGDPVRLVPDRRRPHALLDQRIEECVVARSATASRWATASRCRSPRSRRRPPVAADRGRHRGDRSRARRRARSPTERRDPRTPAPMADGGRKGTTTTYRDAGASKPGRSASSSACSRCGAASARWRRSCRAGSNGCRSTGWARSRATGGSTACSP